LAVSFGELQSTRLAIIGPCKFAGACCKYVVLSAAISHIMDVIPLFKTSYARQYLTQAIRRSIHARQA
jgi:hypothetical protein